MKTRVITGIALGVVFVPIFIVGGLLFQLAMLLLTIGATYELYKLYNTKEQLKGYIVGVYIIISGSVYSMIMSYFNGVMVLEWIFLALIVTMIIGGLLLVFDDQFHSDRFGQLLISTWYPALGFASIFALRSIDLYTIGFLFLITISTDIFAYIVGINFGKHRLAVKISPKKSVEGSIGGTAFALIFAVLYIILFDLDTLASIPINIGWVLLLTAVLSIIGQIGDLVASKLKRYMGIKDFSNLFPGHGGIMDRFDSVLFASLVFVLISQVVNLL